MSTIQWPRTPRIACLGAVLAAVVHCAPSKDASREDDTRSASSRVVLEHFPSTQSAETGVNQWDVGDLTTPEGRFFVARGYEVENGARTFVLEIVSRVGAHRDWSVRGVPILGESQARAIARDVEAMSAVLRSGAPATGGVAQKNIALRACEPGSGGDNGGLVSDCATQLIGCSQALTRAGAAASEAAQAIGSDPARAAVGSPEPPGSATLEGAAEVDTRCAQEDWLEPNDVTYVYPYDSSNPGTDFDRLMSPTQPNGPKLWPDPLFGLDNRTDFREPITPERTSSVIWTALNIARPDVRGPYPPPQGPMLGQHSAIDLQYTTRSGSRFDALNGANWKVVSFRFDPCAPPPADSGASGEEACTVELRFVASPFSDSRIAEDVAAHLIFRFGTGAAATAKRDELIADLLALKKEARAVAPESSGPLRTYHPALAAGGPAADAFRAHVREFVARHADPGHLAEVAFFGQSDTLRFLQGREGHSDTWEFFRGDVTDGGSRFALTPVPNVSSTDQKSQLLTFRDRAGIKPAPRDSFTGRNIQTDLSLNPRNADCVSCHQPPTPEQAGAEDPTPSGFRNIHLLSPFGGRLTVRHRVRVETDEVVRRVNEVLSRR